LCVQDACTLTPDANKGQPEGAPTTSPCSMSLNQPRVFNQRGAQQSAAAASSTVWVASGARLTRARNTSCTPSVSRSGRGKGLPASAAQGTAISRLPRGPRATRSDQREHGGRLQLGRHAVARLHGRFSHHMRPTLTSGSSTPAELRVVTSPPTSSTTSLDAASRGPPVPHRRLALLGVLSSANRTRRTVSLVAFLSGSRRSLVL